MTTRKIDANDTPTALAEAIARVSDWNLPSPVQEPPSKIQLITQAGAHKIYQAEVITDYGNQKVIIRLPVSHSGQTDPSTRMGLAFGMEVANQQIAAEQMLAPDIFWSDPDHQLIVMAHAEKMPSVTEDHLSHCIRGIHGLPLEGERLNLARSMERYHQLAIHRSISKGVLVDPLSSLMKEAIGRLGAEPAVGCHHDLNATNLLRGKGPVAIDWEYAAPGDPYFDVAAACAGNPQLNSDNIIGSVLGGDYDPCLWHIAKGVYSAIDLNWRAAVGQKVTRDESNNVTTYLSEVLR